MHVEPVLAACSIQRENHDRSHHRSEDRPATLNTVERLLVEILRFSGRFYVKCQPERVFKEHTLDNDDHQEQQGILVYTPA